MPINTPSPPCGHARKGIVTSHPGRYESGPHAATNCCDRPACIEGCAAWVLALTGLPGIWVEDSPEIRARPHSIDYLKGLAAGLAAKEG